MARKGAPGEEKEAEGRKAKPRFGIAKLEERKDPRFFVNLPIEYYRIESKAKGSGPAVNASEGGLMVRLSERLKVGQHLRLKLFFSQGSGTNIVEMLSEVVWADNQMQEQDYRCGLRFVNINPEDMNRLNDFLNDLWQGPN